MTPDPHIFLWVVLPCIAFLAGRWWGRTVRAVESTLSTSSASTGPQVVVNVPADYKPLQTLDGKEVVVGERAILWYTVWRAAFDHPDASMTQCREAADAAVDKVYP